MSLNISRRQFVKGIAATVAGVATSHIFSACAAAERGSAETQTDAATKPNNTEATVETAIETAAKPDNTPVNAGESIAQTPYPEYDICGKLSMSELNASEVVVEPITEYAAEESYDVVVIGAGLAGMSAAISAYEAGASVCVLQKHATAMGQGTAGFAIDHERTNH